MHVGLACTQFKAFKCMVIRDMFAKSLEKIVTGSELAVNMLMENKEKIKLFDVYLSVAGSSMVLSKLVNS